ncbi:hypothetical protein UK23_21620 [Lentzea aerocolonigenes]|uniref:ParB-like N-terminal domain-containing protein n=1 Tax=Lentzea aerocolonigenes TaxID=68170 RepID=A0A0F0GU54_LENAE|nr:hypothetical protein UK23_21620 [Lentzea aerocolonigenes]
MIDPVVRLRVDALSCGRPVRIGGENPAHVHRLLRVSEQELPPVVVHRGTMSVVDGRHRLHAARLRGASHITAKVLDCDEVDAFVFALLANRSSTTLPLARADLRAAAEHLLRHRPQWSDRRVAAITGVATRTIARLRTLLGDQSGARVGRDGRTRPTDSVRRRELVRELLLDQPHLSLREVARSTGVSPETVRAVRAGLRSEQGLPVVSRARTGTAGPAGRAIEPMDCADLLGRLRNDPALRSSQRGRALLRLLHLQVELRASWAEIADHLPAHCHDSLAAFARQNAMSWRGLAEVLEREHAS